MSLSSSSLETLFSSTSQSWDLDRLQTALAKSKQAPLSPTERVCLRGLLSGVNPIDIAAALHRQPQGLRVDLTRGLYRHIEALTLEKVKNWREVTASLEKAGYKRSLSLPDQLAAQFNWGEAPDAPVFFGRTQELAQLEQWIRGDSCRVVTIFGMGGMGKTNLSLKLARAIQARFEIVIWRSLLHAPPLADLLADLLQVLSEQPVPLTDPHTAVSRLLQHLKRRRCLLILDNVETILQGGKAAGQYRLGCEGYGQLFQQLGIVPHQSCLLLTSREKPKEIAQLEGKSRPVRSLELAGLSVAEGKQIFTEIGEFAATASEWQQLVAFYNGNPLVLELVAKHVSEVFDGEIAAFLHEGTPLFHDLRDLLDWHFDRLSEPEQEIMYWLAINREPVAIAELKADILSPIAKEQVSATLQLLQRHFPLERKGNRFTHQPVVMEYMTNRLIQKTCNEIASQQIQSFNQYALIKAQAKDYIRETQIRIFLEPILATLQAQLCTKTAIVNQLQQILRLLREQFANLPGYAGGNLINLLHQLKVDLTEYDFSHLAIWQAYLADIKLHRVNLTGANLAKSVFAETFGGISCVAFSPDGQRLVTSDTSGEVQVWNSTTGQQQLALTADTVWTWAVAFSPDGQLFASAGDDYQVKLWDAQTGQCLQVLAGHHNTVNAIAFNPTGNLLASCGQDATIRLWSLDRWAQKGAVCVGILQGHGGRVWSIAFSPDGQTIVSGSEDCTLKLWDVRTGATLKTWSGHTHWIKSVAFSVDGQIIASGSFDGTLKLWDVATEQCYQTWQAHQGCITALTFHPGAEKASDRLLASSSYDQTVKLWDTVRGISLRTWQAHSNRVWWVAFSPNGQLLASGGEDHATRLWDIQTGQSTKTWKGHTNGILSLALSSTQSQLATGHEDQTVKLWQVKTGEIMKTLRGHTNRVWSVAFAPSVAHANCHAELVASGSADRTIKLWDSQTGDCLNTLQGHKSWVWSVAFNPTGNWLASGSYDQTIRLWETRTGECLNILTGHTAPVVSVTFSPDGRLLASSSLDTTIRLWDLPTGRCLQTLQGHKHSVWAIAFSPDGQRLASGSYDKTIKVWETASGHCDRTFEGHTNPVVCLAFSPNGQQIGSGSFDCTLRLWDIQSGQLLQTFCGHTKPVYSLLFESIARPLNPSGTSVADTLLSSSFDETVRFWDIETGRCLNTWREYRPYEGMNITHTTGSTEAQKATLFALGAIEN